MKQLCAILLVVLLIAGAVIGATAYVTHELDGVVAAFTDAGNKFENVVKIFEENKVSGLTRRVVNPANIIKVSEYTFVSGKETGGIKITYDEDGVITLDGKCDEAFRISLGDYYILEEGTYTVAVLADEPARTTTSIRIVADSYSVLADKPFSQPHTFKNSKLQYVKASIDIKYGDEFNNYRIAPVLVAGTNMGTFFVDETVPVTFD